MRRFPRTAYFEQIRSRPDRAMILDEWIVYVIERPVHRQVQADGRIRLWARIAAAHDRYLRVILLEDGRTVHNVFFDRRFRKPSP
ncbi:hypothetical protein LCGC14_3078370 [marine sediment metagenome]|uniref:DUF4258 domain-containing protein n=1 Tax=marine sediment metagenome TaxID=412755 RepID=A0A0F8X2J4_9ZZZZ